MDRCKSELLNSHNFLSKIHIIHTPSIYEDDSYTYLHLKLYPQVYGFNLKRSKGAELRILIVFSYYAILGIGGLTSIIVSSRNLQGYSNARNIYFLCERNGIGAECDRSGFESYITDSGLMTVGSILLHISSARMP